MDYYIFVLGYDLLRERIIKSGKTECDTAYEICEAVYRAFLHSDYNCDGSKSEYENLERFVEDFEFDWEI